MLIIFKEKKIVKRYFFNCTSNFTKLALQVQFILIRFLSITLKTMHNRKKISIQSIDDNVIVDLKFSFYYHINSHIKLFLFSDLELEKYYF